jgi:hypothetical protein
MDFSIVRNSKYLYNAALWKLDQFRSSGEGRVTPTLFEYSWIQLLRLALSKGPNKVGDSLPSPADGNRSSFRNDVFSSSLEFWTMNKVHKPSDSERYSDVYVTYEWSLLLSFMYIPHL